jgi:hypothetical protein
MTHQYTTCTQEYDEVTIPDGRVTPSRRIYFLNLYNIVFELSSTTYTIQN